MKNTINDLISDVAAMLKQVRPECRLYADKMPQSFKKPSFYIQVYDLTCEKRLGSRYEVTVPFDVAYFQGKTDTGDIWSTAESVILALDTLRTPKSGRYVQDISSRVTDDVLHILFDIKYHGITRTEYEKMRKMAPCITFEFEKEV